ncbi:unnamed protein product [Ectocarpus sp. 12 AP-2014]
MANILEDLERPSNHGLILVSPPPVRNVHKNNSIPPLVWHSKRKDGDGQLSGSSL